MITLIRWCLLKAKEIKLKLAFWSFIDQIINEIVKNGDGVEKKLIAEISKLIHEDNKNKNEVESK